MDAVIRSAGDMANKVARAASVAGGAISEATRNGVSQASRSLADMSADAARAGSNLGTAFQNGASRVGRAVSGAIGSLEDLGRAGRNAGEQGGDGVGDGGERGGRRFTEAMRRAAAAANQALGTVASQDVISPRMESIGRSAAAKLSGALKAGLAGVGLSVGAGLAATLGAGLDRLVTIDTARTKLKALGNDAKAVEQIMKNANTAVKGTAFGMGDAATIAASAVAAGVEPGKQLERYLRMTADAAAVAGVDLADMGSIMNQVQTNGVAMTDSFQQLADRGIPIFTWLSEATGKSGEDLMDMISEGKVSAQMFQDIIAKNIGGAAVTMGTSVRGQFENMKAAMGRFGAALIGPFFNQAGGALSGVTTFFDNMTTGATASMTKLNDWIMGTLVPGIQSGISKFTEMGNSTGMFDRIGNIFTTLKDTANQLWPSLLQIGQSLGTATAAVGFSSFDILLRIIEALLPVLNMLVGALDWLSRLMADNQTAVTVLVGAYTAWKTAILVARGAQAGLLIVQGLVTGLQQRSTIALAGHTAAIAVNSAAAKVAAGAQTAWMIATNLLNGTYIRQAAALVASTAAAIAHRAVMVAGAIATGIMTAAQWALNSALLANPITWIVILIVGLIAVIVLIATKTTWFQTAWEYAWNAIKVAAEWVWNALKVVWDAMVAAWNWVWNAIKAGIGFIVGGWQWLLGVIRSVIDWIKQKFAEFVLGVQIIWGAVKDVVGKVVGKFREMLNFIGSIPGKVRGWFGDAGRWLYDAGKNIIQGLINGAGSLLKNIGNFFLDKIPGWIKGPFKKALGIESPSTVFAGYGKNIGQGLIVGVSGMKGQVQASTQALANSAANISMPTVAGPEIGAPVASGAVPDMPAMGGEVAPPTEGAAATTEAWTTSATALQTVATTLIGPTMTTLQQGVTDYGLNTQMQLGTIVNPAWTAAGTNLVATKVGLLDPTMTGIQSMTNLTAGVTANSVYGVMNPAWQNMGNNVAAVFNGSVNPVMGAMRGAVANTAAAFGQGASNIASQWNRVREATASPVRFAIGAVFNDGIVGMWNSVSDLLGTQRMNPYPIRFKTGGAVPGSGVGDKVPALLEPQEFVVPRQMAAAIGGGSLKRGLSMLDSVRRKGPTSGLGSEGLFSAVASRYAGGGPVKGSPAWNAVKRGMGFAARYNGRPYVWGGSLGANGGTDCSGYMSSIADVILGGSGLSRKWATGAFPGGGASQRASASVGGQLWQGGLRAGMSIGVSPEHTAGTLGGFAGLPATNVESGGSHGNVAYGGPAVGADHSQFPTRWHLPIVNEMFMSGGGGGGGADLGGLVSAITGQAWGGIMSKARSWQGGGHIGEYPAKLATKMKAVTQAKIDKLLEEMMRDPGGAGAERWRPMAKRAMMRVGFNAADVRQVNAMIAQIASESGGNPSIAQQITDVNGTGESAGVGLLQIIPSTWAAFRDPQLPDDRRNPFANMVGALRYYKARYGMDLTKMWGHGHGYDLGGIAAKSGWLQKPINVPERVLSPAQTKAFEAWMDAGGHQGDTIVLADTGLSDLAGRIMDEMEAQGFRSTNGYRLGADGRTGSRTTVLVNQYIEGGDSQETADEVERRLLDLI